MPALLKTAPPRTEQPCPAGSWDVHHHIFELDGRFPLSSMRHFTPSSATLTQLEAFQHKMGIDHVSMSHGLSFGTDMTSLRHYMKHFAGGSRAYGCVDIETVTDDEIKELQSEGIVGTRIDFHLYKAQHNVEEQMRRIRQYGDRVAALGWGLSIYHPHPEYYPTLAPIIRAINTPVVIDHFGGLKTASLLQFQGLDTTGFDATTQPGLEALKSLLAESKLWIKLSAPYRVSEDPSYDDMQPIVRALVEANPDRVLYGSDWPHTQPFHRRPKDLKGTDVERYLDFDDLAWVGKLKSWLSDSEWQKLMVDNPRAFLKYDEKD